MKCFISSLLIYFALLITAVNTTHAQHNEMKEHSQAEALYGIQMGDEEMTIYVKSNGCTRNEHFELVFNQVVSSHGMINELTVKRLGRDHCRRMPFVKRIKLSIDEGQEEFILMNPLKLWKTNKRQ